MSLSFLPDLSNVHPMTLLAFFVISLLVTLVAVTVIVVRLPEDYFQKEHGLAFEKYPLPLRVLMLIGKNLLGLALALMGAAMLVLPGQGVIVLLIGMLLLDFPGKYHAERWLVRKGPVLHLLNWLRRKFHKKALKL